MISPSEADLIRRAIEARLAEVHVSMPGIVKSYDPATRTATVTPAIRRVLADDDDTLVAEDLPALQNVPVCWPAGGGFELHFPLAAGDTGDLVFSTSSMAEWRNTGLVSTPGDLRKQSISHAKFYPGLRSGKASYPDVPASGVAVISVGSGLLSVGPAGSSDFVALAAKVDAAFTSIKNLFSGWTPVPNDGGAALKAASSSLNFPTVKASKLKAV